jgi:hypothetical protein
MSDLTPLREAVLDLAHRTPSPDFDDLRRRATQRGRRRAGMATALTAASVVVGVLAATRALDSSDETLPSVDPTVPASESPTSPVGPETPWYPDEAGKELNDILTSAPDWAVVRPAPSPENSDYAFNGPCSGDWRDGAISGGDGGVLGTSLDVGHGKVGFSSEARASDAEAELVENLASCTKTAWRTRPIPQTGSVLASSDRAVVWIHMGFREVHVLQVSTTSGAPPASVQAAVAEWLVAYIAAQNTD